MMMLETAGVMAMVEVGQQLRAVRRSKGITLTQLAALTNLSRSFLSQIEAGTANPSVGTLKKVADALGLTMAALFSEGESDVGNANEAEGRQGKPVASPVRVVRRDRRKILQWPGRPWKTYLLTPNLQGKLEVLLNELEPGDTFDESYTHEGEEFGLVLEGSYEVTVGDEVYVLEAGDSISYPSHLPHKMRVVGDRPVKALWVITPPSF
jgi:transcriptional regulator with XRE-family HTH domain